MNIFDKIKIEKYLNKFNQVQKIERDKLSELSFKYKSSRSDSSLFFLNNSNILNNFSNQFQVNINEQTANMNKAINHAKGGVSNWSIHRMKSNENLFQANGSTPSSFISSLFQGSSSKSKESNSFIVHTPLNQSGELCKTGYLLKKSYHTRVRTWLRRKCKTENGMFFIFHSDVC